jgi:hypothetical protein
MRPELEDKSALSQGRPGSHVVVVAPEAASPGKEEELCARCRGLDLGSYLDGHKTQELWTPTTWASLRETCTICRQILGLFSEPTTIDSGSFRRTGTKARMVYLRSFDRQKNPRYPVLTITSGERAFELVEVIQDGMQSAVSGKITPALGRVVAGGGPDYGIVKEWLDHCHANHTSKCGRTTKQDGTLLRVIDCRTRELQIVPPGTAYVALSYLWGSDVSDTEWNQRKLPDQIPKTIEDSIAVTLALGMSYIWIDRYSINQNDPNEKHDIIQNMDKIYQAAQLTVIACEGAGPSHGLPGVCKTPRRSQYQLRIGRHKLVALASASDQIRASRWIRRGWVCPWLQ